MSDVSRFGELIDGLPALVFESDLSASLAVISPYWTELTGQSLEEAKGFGWMKHLDPNSVSSAFSTMEEALKRGEIVRYVARCRDRHGDWCWLRVVAKPRMVDGQVAGINGVGMVVPGPDEVATPVSNVKLEELQRLAARSDALLSASPDVVFHLSASGQYIGYRAGDLSRLHLRPDDFLGKNLDEVLPEMAAKQARAAIARATQIGAPQPFSYEQTLHDELLCFEARAVPLLQGDALIVVRDVTEAHRSEAALVAAREEALERSRLKTQFLANVSHEIRTPLNGILGVTQLLKQHSLPAEFGEYVDVLQGAGESLLAIVNDVLDLSKIEANRLELEPRVFDLEQVVSETTKSFLAVVQRKRLDLSVHVDAQAKGPVRGDPARVRQIINNLVGNALKFTDTGSVKLEVRRQGERVRIQVIDTGPGIAVEHQERIFEPFEQADVGVQRRFGGTGLGLAITRRIARLMGGDVSVDSRLGHGARFELEVPLPSVVINATPQTSSRITPTPRSLRVLLAEDDPVNAAMTAALLGKLGHEVSVVGNGTDCVEQSKRTEIDLVLMDVHMPELDGLAATRVIRERERGSNRHLPIVALTANAMKGDDLRCLSAGMDAYLPKPVTVSALKDLLIWFGSKAI